MRTYIVPPDVNEKEKVIGGILNINQFLWLLSSFVLGIIVFVSTYFLVGRIALLYGGITTLLGVPFVLVKIKGLTLFEFFKRQRAFEKKIKELPNKRINQYWE